MIVTGIVTAIAFASLVIPLGLNLPNGTLEKFVEYFVNSHGLREPETGMRNSLDGKGSFRRYGLIRGR